MTDEDAHLWSRQPSDGAVVRPSADEALPWSTTTVEAARTNTVYLVGCHGGAGVDTLATLVEGTTAAGRSWPVRADGDDTTSLPVVLVARMSLGGLTAAQFALRQYATAGVPDGTELLGLALVAASPRSKLSKPEETKRRLIADGVTPLAPHVWQIKWHPELLGLALEDLPSYSSTTDAPTRRARSLTSGVTADVTTFGSALSAFLVPEYVDELIDDALPVEDDNPGDEGVQDSAPVADAVVDEPLTNRYAWSPSVQADRVVPRVPALPQRRDRGAEDDAVTEQIPVVATTFTPSGPDGRHVADQIDVPPVETSVALNGAGAAPGRNKKRWILVAATAGCVAALGGITAAVALGGESDNAAPVAAPVISQTQSATNAPVEVCPSKVVGDVTSGADAGDQKSGPAVIKAFNYAYYVQRSAKNAQAVAARGALAPEAQMQRSLDADIPAGTAHCLAITQRGPGLFFVELTQTPPDDGAPIVYRQLIRTTEADGKHWIASIKSATN